MIDVSNMTMNLTGRAVDKCLENGYSYRTECLYRMLCPQFSHYFVVVGVALIILYLVSGWLLWAWWKFLNPRVRWEALYEKIPLTRKILGNMRHPDTILYWDTFIRDRITKLLLGYIVVVVYMSLSR